MLGRQADWDCELTYTVHVGAVNMRRRQCFTLDEAVAEMMRDADEEFMFGGHLDSSEDEEDISDDEERDKNVRSTEDVASAAVRCGSRTSVSAGALSGSNVPGASGTASAFLGGSPGEVDAPSESEEDEGQHFLDREVDSHNTARAYTTRAGGVEGTIDSGSSATQSNPPPDLACGCNQACLRHFARDEIEAHRLNLCEMVKVEKDMLVMGVLLSVQCDGELTRRGKRKHVEYRYCFQGERVCAGAFRYLYDLGDRTLKNIKQHMAKHGAVPRVHGNCRRRSHNALTFDEVENCAKFIKAYSNEHGLPHPAPLHGRDEMPPTYLPASMMYKSIHAEYAVSCTQATCRAAGLTVFRHIWRSCFAHVKIMTARTDVCHRCELHRQSVMMAVDELDKTTALATFTAHMHQAQREREVYRQATVAADAELKEHHPTTAPPYPPCSQPLKAMHYTFDFAQQVTLPHMYRQPGPLYFKTPRKIQLFGVCSEGVPKQVNYLLDESDTIGPNGTKSHGANTVVSLLHDFFRRHGHGEEECVLHADNCAGQNKNRTVVNYLAWRVALGLHRKITLCFMIAGHTRCLVDGCFGLVKRKYRRSDIYTVGQLEAVVNSSAVCNVAQRGDDVNWYEWDSFMDQHFRKIKGISKQHHFTFDAAEPGKVTVRELDGSPAQLVEIAKGPIANLSAALMPPILPRGGVTEERATYLYKEIRQFVAPHFKDELCPPP